MILAFKKLTPAKGLATHNTKPKHNSRNHLGSMGLETPPLTVPLEAFVMAQFSS
ncbi:Uncharacterised protein [Vibrio cholerae]|nr:Uncharacterised protein [Vibrio cholerae]